MPEHKMSGSSNEKVHKHILKQTTEDSYRHVDTYQTDAWTIVSEELVLPVFKKENNRPQLPRFLFLWRRR